MWCDVMWCDVMWGETRSQENTDIVTLLSFYLIMIFTSSHPVYFYCSEYDKLSDKLRDTCKRIVIHLRPAQIYPKEKTTWLRYHLPLPLFPLPALFSLLSCIYVPAWSKMNVYSFPLQTLSVMERLSEEHNHKSDPAMPTSLVSLQLANYYILKRVDSLPTNNRTATKVIIRPPPSILSWIFFFFLFLLV